MLGLIGVVLDRAHGHAAAVVAVVGHRRRVPALRRVGQGRLHGRRRPERPAVHEGQAPLDADPAQERARRQRVDRADHDVDLVPGDGIHGRGVEAPRYSHVFRIGGEARGRARGPLGLARADVVWPKQELARQVRGRDGVVVADRDAGHAQQAQVLQQLAARRARADDEHARRLRYVGDRRRGAVRQYLARRGAAQQPAAHGLEHVVRRDARGRRGRGRVRRVVAPYDSIERPPVEARAVAGSKRSGRERVAQAHLFQYTRRRPQPRAAPFFGVDGALDQRRLEGPGCRHGPHLEDRAAVEVKKVALARLVALPARGLGAVQIITKRSERLERDTFPGRARELAGRDGRAVAEVVEDAKGRAGAAAPHEGHARRAARVRERAGRLPPRTAGRDAVVGPDFQRVRGRDARLRELRGARDRPREARRLGPRAVEVRAAAAAAVAVAVAVEDVDGRDAQQREVLGDLGADGVRARDEHARARSRACASRPKARSCRE